MDTVEEEDDDNRKQQHCRIKKDPILMVNNIHNVKNKNCICGSFISSSIVIDDKSVLFEDIF